MQERVNSGVTEKFIVHKPMERFIVNTHAFHNAHLLREVLPRTLIAPIPLFADRKAKHYELAVSLREIKNGKRKRAAEKRTAAKKKKEGELQVQDPKPVADPKDVDSDPELEDSDDTEDEEAERPRKKQRRGKNPVVSDSDSDSDSEYDGRVELVQIGAPRTSGRVRRLTERGRQLNESPEDSE